MGGPTRNEMDILELGSFCAVFELKWPLKRLLGMAPSRWDQKIIFEPINSTWKADDTKATFGVGRIAYSHEKWTKQEASTCAKKSSFLVA